ncbi:uncharacterized protein TRAVEDRAFT_41524 [Trametes versicolor FP-101664 SS1]|uniref:uncharacterized protein n=1 Tax=Trametes versicolor (strain FP-101664) TaxID=717944 RepID=UPI00046235B4|nr:uncharacterized protein TRAVEDRAFT_41524 [Trametes versicolor FP-101664 SS1]EIW64108.1 hypothetical protein TRAVEDRAFT_41524 [Trametes versicolor FP-101664 SS1]
MRLPVILCTAALVNTVFAAALLETPISAAAQARGLDGFFDGLQDQSQTATAAHDHTQVGPDATPTATPSTPGDANLKSLLGLSSSATDTATAKGKGKETNAIPTGTAYSIIGSLPPIHTPSAAYSPMTPATSTASTDASSPTTAAAANTESATSSGTSEWKIIGVAVIAFTTVAGILLLSVFFDHWWRFVRGLVCRNKGNTDEELVPDWEKAEWDMRCGQDRQRYPSFSSLPSAAKVQAPPPAAPGPSRNSYSEAGTSAGLAGYHQEARRNRTPSGVGLGLGRVGSTRSQRSQRSPSIGGAAGRSPFAKHKKAAYEGAPQNPFDDIHSPTPEDVYGGVVH